jgi:predicted ATPase/class 3 adenylate cyclase/Tfp pilus assembly protein PilF
MTELPAGTVTLVFTDIEGSTRLLASLGSRYEAVLGDHRKLLRDAFSSHGGIEVDTQGDAFFYAFAKAHDALRAAVKGQRALASHPWPNDAELRVRMGIHTGEPTVTAEGYVGSDVHLGARLCAAAWGEQILVSDASARLVADNEDASLRDLGEHTLKDIENPVSLYQVIVAGLRADFPPPRTASSHPTNLPPTLAPLVGRAEDISELTYLLSSSEVRVVTLTGPGGVGKTRLALAVGQELLSSFSDGVFFVDLSALSDPALVTGAIAGALGLRESPGRSLIDTVADYLASRQMLLILDNLEHLLAAAPDISARVSSAPSLKVLVTSREPLRIAGEHEIPLAPLGLPSKDGDRSVVVSSPAVELFLTRARALRPGFELTEQDASSVAAICRRLDGLPLAIELAAARVKVLSLSALASRLEQSLAALGQGRRDVSARQRTLRGAIEWSYDLLAPDEQTLFRRLGVFAGGFTLEAAEAICDRDDLSLDVLDGLASLVDKSLVRAREDEDRFVMLESIRSFAADELEASGEAEDVRRAHAEFFARLTEEAVPHLMGENQEQWLHALHLDLDNIRATFEWCLYQEPEMAMRVTTAMWAFWDLRGYISEGRRSLQQSLTRCTNPSKARMRATQAAGVLAEMQDDYEESAVYAQEALSLAGRFGGDAEAARALITLGRVALQKGNAVRASALLEEALPLAEGSKDDQLIVRVLVNLAIVRSEQGERDESISLNERSARIAAASGDRRGRMMALGNLGEDAAIMGRFDYARRVLREALSLAGEVGDAYYETAARINLGIVSVMKDDMAHAAQEFYTALISAADLGSSYLVVSCLDGLAAAESREDASRAARLLAISDGLRRRIGLPRSLTEQQIYEPHIAPLRKQLENAEELIEAAELMSLDEAVVAASNRSGDSATVQRPPYFS